MQIEAKTTQDISCTAQDMQSVTPVETALETSCAAEHADIET